MCEEEWVSRKTDLEDSIHESYAIIRKYEIVLQTSDRPEEMARANRIAQEQWTLIEGYLKEYLALCNGQIDSQDIKEIAISAGIQTPSGAPLKPKSEPVIQQQTAPTQTPPSATEAPEIAPKKDAAGKEIKYGLKRLGSITIVLIGLLSIFVPILIDQCQVQQSGDELNFDYQVRVKVQSTGDFIENAVVIIEVSGKAPLDAVTDSNGLARVFIPSEYVGKPGVLIVKAPEYEMYTENMDLTKDALPDIVLLKPRQ